jgi:hypothetical protein
MLETSHSMVMFQMRVYSIVSPFLILPIGEYRHFCLLPAKPLIISSSHQSERFLENLGIFSEATPFNIEDLFT